MKKEERAACMEEQLPFYAHLTEEEKKELEACTVEVRFEKNTPVHSSDEQCLGMLLFAKGRTSSLYVIRRRAGSYFISPVLRGYLRAVGILRFRCGGL